MASQEGLTVKKLENFSEWYTELLLKAELIDYSAVSGCYILRPRAYALWEAVQADFDRRIKADGVRNCYFPLFIPESLLTREQEHVAGFAPEVAWVTEGGGSKLAERLAVRPTSETIMYASYAQWIRSYKDLPLRLNQWCSVVRWEFKHPVPFLRSREFLWQEGHTVFATKAEADAEARKILGFYADVYREVLALPTLSGRKSSAEKFAGADYSLSLESFVPNGKAIQACTSHHLGQHFSRAFSIQYMDAQEQLQYAWQNSWGLTTRCLGIMLMTHSDDKGLVLPPRIAPEKVVLVPIFLGATSAALLEKAEYLSRQLKEYGAFVDARTDVRPGAKYAEWELRGIPLRLELGPKDLEASRVIAVRRDTAEKVEIPFSQLKKRVEELLAAMQRDLYVRAEAYLLSSLVKTTDFSVFSAALAEKKIGFVPFCETAACEEDLKAALGGAKTLNTPLDAVPCTDSCIRCGKPAAGWFYFGKSY